MAKSPDAFRTISEVAEFLETPAHVLRFWESRFPQIKPVKRAGGRRYYRPADVALLTGIKRLLHDEGMTIRGVQKILREQGVRFVSGMNDDTAAEDENALQAALVDTLPEAEEIDQGAPQAQGTVETAQVIALQKALADRGKAPPENETPDLFEAVVPQPDMDLEEAPLAVTSDAVEETIQTAGADADAAPSEEVEEAPMALWVEDEADAAPPTLSELKVTRIGHSAPQAPSAPAIPVEAIGEPEHVQTLASRLRKVTPENLTAADRATIALIRARARSLRDRLSSPARHGF